MKNTFKIGDKIYCKVETSYEYFSIYDIIIDIDYCGNFITREWFHIEPENCRHVSKLEDVLYF